MKIPEYQNVHGVNASNLWLAKAGRVEKIHEDQFEKQLEDSIRKRKSEINNRRRNKSPRGEKLDETQLKVDQLFAEYDQKDRRATDIDSDEEKPNNGKQFSSWI